MHGNARVCTYTDTLLKHTSIHSFTTILSTAIDLVGVNTALPEDLRTTKKMLLFLKLCFYPDGAAALRPLTIATVYLNPSTCT